MSGIVESMIARGCLMSGRVESMIAHGCSMSGNSMSTMLQTAQNSNIYKDEDYFSDFFMKMLY
ncbi:hypothetical protein DV702_05805 [Sporosarcina sp. PTS2304]|uniref:hypothetical protein n=1 Tax=Sporosarcina sp. PTS2304 TaxID=2283194 RepID=UPI000E0CE13D|nr:hypothetical protein [Sporosarcina sp. PTS2304]AXH99297.1 hypothetical protein DV702_05805 [Sporosarcina sp. PTS2304]